MASNLSVRGLVLTLTVAAVFSLAACGGSPAPTAAPVAAVEPTATPTSTPAPSDTPTPALSPTSTPAPRASTKTISVAINPAFKPFIYVEAGKLAGFDIDLLNALGEAADVEVGFASTSFEDLLAGVTSGKYDAGISAITVTDARKQQMNFTDPYFESGQVPLSFYSAGQGIAVPISDTTIAGVDGLTETVKVGVKQGTTGAAFVAQQTAAQAVDFPESLPALQALAGGEIDAVVLDSAVLADYIKNNPGAIKMVGGPVTSEQYAIAVTKSKPEVLAMLNEALAEIRANGVYNRLVDKWFGAP